MRITNVSLIERIATGILSDSTNMSIAIDIEDYERVVDKMGNPIVAVQIEHCDTLGGLTSAICSELKTDELSTVGGLCTFLLSNAKNRITLNDLDSLYAVFDCVPKDAVVLHSLGYDKEQHDYGMTILLWKQNRETTE